jgi:hypothetical protein
MTARPSISARTQPLARNLQSLRIVVVDFVEAPDGPVRGASDNP